MSTNIAILHGNLGQDPEVRYMPNGNAACNFSLATSNKWKDKNTQEMKEKTEWHRVVAFGKLAEIIGKMAIKGTSCVVTGEIRYRKWQDSSGQEKYTTEIMANAVDFTKGMSPMGADKPQSNQQAPANQPAPNNQSGGFDDFDDDIPF